MKFELKRIQQALEQEGLDGWLFVDHHRRDPLAYRILGLPSEWTPTRRWYYLVRRSDEPIKLVHRIEAQALASLPGMTLQYASWVEHVDQLSWMLSTVRRVAMQYSPRCEIPYVANVDAGTVELVRSFGVEVCSSADLVQLFEARWTPAQLASHLEAARRIDRIRRETFVWLGNVLRQGQPLTEWDVKCHVLEAFARERLRTDHGPIVAADDNTADPHYEPQAGRARRIRPGSWVLLDLWAKLDEPESVYYDTTWTAYCGATVPDAYLQVFDVVVRARDAALTLVEQAVNSGRLLRGYEIDDAARAVIREAGYGERFPHRTGHSLGQDVHGAGANADNWETHDERRILPGTAFTIEPGVYLETFGVRSEVDVYVGEDRMMVTGEVQREPVRI